MSQWPPHFLRQLRARYEDDRTKGGNLVTCLLLANNNNSGATLQPATKDRSVGRSVRRRLCRQIVVVTKVSDTEMEVI